jgi:hypothetical protein
MNMRVVLDLVPGAGARRVLSDLSHPEWLNDPDAVMRHLMPMLAGDAGLTKPKAKRMPSKTYAARLAKREGVEVKLAPDGTLTMKPIKTFDIITPANDTDPDSFNEWDTVQ